MICTLLVSVFGIGSVAHAEEVDRAPSGIIVTVRPDMDRGERAWILSEANQPIPLPTDLPQPMWLVHPESWRQAVALAEKYDAQIQLPTELKQLNVQLETELNAEKKLRSGLRLDLEASEATRIAEVKALRRSRTHWAIGTGVIGVVGGAVITGLVLK